MHCHSDKWDTHARPFPSASPSPARPLHYRRPLPRMSHVACRMPATSAPNGRLRPPRQRHWPRLPAIQDDAPRRAPRKATHTEEMAHYQDSPRFPGDQRNVAAQSTSTLPPSTSTWSLTLGILTNAQCSHANECVRRLDSSSRVDVGVPPASAQHAKRPPFFLKGRSSFMSTRSSPQSQLPRTSQDFPRPSRFHQLTPAKL